MLFQEERCIMRKVFVAAFVFGFVAMTTLAQTNFQSSPLGPLGTANSRQAAGLGGTNSVNPNGTANVTPPPTSAHAPEPEMTGVHVGPISISGSMDVGVYWDSNPAYASGKYGSDVRSATALRFDPEITLAIKKLDWDATLRSWYTYDYFLDPSSGSFKDIIDQKNYGEDFSLNFYSPRGTHLNFTESYELEDRMDVVNVPSANGGVINASWQPRQNITVGGKVDTPVGEKTTINAGLNGTDLIYNNPALYDWRALNGSLGVARQITPKTDLCLNLTDSIQKGSGVSGMDELWCVSIGARSHNTTHITYKIDAGFMGYSFNNGEYTDSGLFYDASATWSINSRLTATLSGGAAIQPTESATNNYTLNQSIALGLSYVATRRLTTTFNAVYSHADYNGEPQRNPITDALATRDDDQVALYARADYRLQRHVGLFLSAEYTKNLSSIDFYDYDRFFVEAGVKVMF